MGRTCDLCSRGSNTANNRSKSNIATKRKQKVNLQKQSIGGVRALICTKCQRTLNKATVK